MRKVQSEKRGAVTEARSVKEKQSDKPDPESMLRNSLIGILEWQRLVGNADLESFRAEFLELLETDDFPEIASDDVRIFKAEQIYGEVDDLVHVVEETLVLLKEVMVKQKYHYALESLRKAEAHRDAEKTEYFKTLCKDLLMELQKLREKREEFNN